MKNNPNDELNQVIRCMQMSHKLMNWIELNQIGFLPHQKPAKI